ncbi:MAG: hypothetical protein U0169_08235 [Polyangiaceae bacterium]
MKFSRPVLVALSVASLATLAFVPGCADSSVPQTDAPAPVDTGFRMTNFSNGGFEEGTLNNWTPVVRRRNGDGNGSGIHTFPPTTVADLGLQVANGSTTNRSSAVGAATTGFPIPTGLVNADSLRYPFQGSFAAVVNENGDNANANYIRQSPVMTVADVDPTDNKIHLRFAVAPVLESPAHVPNQQPYFFIELRNTTKNIQLFNSFNFANQPGVSWKTSGNSSQTVLYTDWEAFDVAPGAAGLDVGDTVEATIVAAGCAFSAHFGEVYVDQFSTSFALPNVNVSAPSSTQASTDLTYTIVAKNGGTGPATGSVVTFATPILADNSNPIKQANATFQSISSPGITCTTPTVGTAGTISCPVGTLSPGGSYTFTVTVRVPALPSGSTAPVNVNAGTYSIDTDQTTPLGGGLVQTLVTTASPVDLFASMTDGKAAGIWGTTNRYTLTVTNRGPNAANGVTITDTRPGTLSSPTWSCVGSGGATCGAASGTGAINTTANLPVNGTVTYTIDTSFTGGPATATVSYTATASPPSGMVQSVVFDNVAVDTTSVAAAVVSVPITKTGNGEGTISISPGPITCTASCTSTSGNFVSGSTIAPSAIPAPGHTFVGWSGACTGTATTCTATVGAGTSIGAQFDAPVLANALTTTSNGGGSSVRPGDTATYTTTVTIPNGNNASVVVTEALPTGLTYSSLGTVTSTGTITCGGGGCTAPTVTPGSSTTLDFGIVTCTTVGGCTLTIPVVDRVAATTNRGDNLVPTFTVAGRTPTTAPALTVVEPNLTMSRSATPTTGLSTGSTSTVTVTLANDTGGANADARDGVVTLPIPAGLSAGSYVAGTCPAATPTFGANAVFTFPSGVTVATGATCTFSYVLTVLNSATPNTNVTVPSGTVASTSTGGAAPPAKSYSVSDATFALGIAGLPNGTACTGDAVCVSNVCHGGDNACGRPNGAGPCDGSNAAVVCRSGSCSVSGVCSPPGGCVVDGDCTSSQFCNTTTSLCTPKLPNGSDIPTIGGHTPPIAGLCTVDAAPVVCTSSVCDVRDAKCGYADGVGPCNSVNAGVVCRSGACSTSNVCMPAAGCIVDGDCTSSQFCNTETFLCVQKRANGDAIPTVANHTPALTGDCDTNVQSVVCASLVCDVADDKCGYDVGHGPCTNATASTVCRSGACSTTLVCMPNAGCLVDADCTTSQYCDTPTKACVAKVPNGGPVPTVAGHTPPLAGTCDAPAATASCASGVCDVADQKCGYADGHGTCTTQNAATVCRSGGCSTTGVCLPPSGCVVDADCTSTQYCDTTQRLCVGKEPNGDPIPTLPGHAPPVGGTCTVAAANVVCQSAVCDTTDDKCGYANGTGPCTATNAMVVCRGGACSTSGVCIPINGCRVDSECGATQFCDTSSSTCSPKLPNGTSVPTVAGHVPPLTGECNAATGAVVCVSAVCDEGDDKCGYPDGRGTCTQANAKVVCRSGSCGANGVCRAPTGCTVDAECDATQFCNTPAKTCETKLTNGSAIPSIAGHTPAVAGTCTAEAGAVVCASAVCDTADQKCGFADGHGTCTSANASTVCRTGKCSPAGNCGSATGCVADSECTSDATCVQGTCTPKPSGDGGVAPNGATLLGGGLPGCHAAPAASSRGGFSGVVLLGALAFLGAFRRRRTD